MKCRQLSAKLVALRKYKMQCSSRQNVFQSNHSTIPTIISSLPPSRIPITIFNFLLHTMTISTQTSDPVERFGAYMEQNNLTFTVCKVHLPPPGRSPINIKSRSLPRPLVSILHLISQDPTILTAQDCRCGRKSRRHHR